MPKKNSLKVAPFAKYKTSTWEYDETLRPNFNRYSDPTYDYKGISDAYYASGVETITFDGMTLLEYTRGAPGDQESIGYGNTGSDIDWRPNVPFAARLTIRELERGRSAARFWFEDVAHQVRYPFFGQTLVDMLTASYMDHGQVEGMWIVVKKGSNYGIELYR